MGVTTNEFPLLNAVGLYVKHTAGNGNCLFNALSDQMYGDQSRHGDLRSGVIRHMRENAQYYKQFIDVRPGGGLRRNPKRKNTGSSTAHLSTTVPTQEEIDRNFESHLRSMARGGTYGDNMEITAFSKAFQVDVRIYQRDFAYVVSTAPMGTVPMVHIAYHAWEHYSSIRNVTGPHTGLPEIRIATVSDDAQTEETTRDPNVPSVQSWKVELVINSFPNLSANRPTIQKTIEDCNGNVDDAISRLLEPDGQSSTSSARGSSSVERDIDSEDEDPIRGPNKRQDRRLSRATRAIAKETGDQPNQELSFRLKDNVMSTTGQYSTTSRRNNTAAAKLAKLEDANETEEEDWRTDSPYKDSESASVSTSASDFSSASKPPPGIIRLKLSQPKKPLERCETPSTSSREQEAISRKTISHYKGQQGTSPKRRPAARDRYGVKKAAQKAAAKERKQAVAAKQPTSGKNAALPFIMKPGKENAPAIEAHIKVLYI